MQTLGSPFWVHLTCVHINDTVFVNTPSRSEWSYITGHFTMSENDQKNPKNSTSAAETDDIKRDNNSRKHPDHTPLTRREVVGAVPKVALGVGLASADQKLNAFTNGLFMGGRKKKAYELWISGQNTDGQLGLGTITHRSSLVQVGGSKIWSQFAAGFSSALALKQDGTMWSCGNNQSGRLGLGDTIDRSSPVQVGSLSTWSLVSQGVDHSMAIRTDGTLWTWGNGGYGKLGISSGQSSRSSPTQIGTLSNWNKIAAAADHSLALRTDGTLWSWGQNLYGELGLSVDNIRRSSPVQVGSLSTWSQIQGGNISLALRSDGTMWSFGENHDGQLGIGATNRRSIPTQIGNLSNWKEISVKIDHSLALRTDGTMWSWGPNFYYPLGVWPNTDRSSPVQVGSLSTWSKVAAGDNSCMAVRTDGTLWSWGWGSSGPLALGDTSLRSSPVQVGNLSTWKSVFGGGRFLIAFKT